MNFSVEEGDFVAIMGPSGSGKSTMMNILGCLDRPTSGKYYLDGKEVAGLSDDELARTRNAKIGFVFQNFNLLSKISAQQNVALPLVYAGVSEEERMERARIALRDVGLEDRLDHKPNELSGGQRQRVAIARALAADPKVLLCDEATSALDPKITGEILELLAKINRERKLTIVIITHEMSVVERICHRVAIIDDGYLAEVGDVAEVFRSPKTRAAKKLVFPSNPYDPSEKDSRLLRIAFDGLSAREPFIADLVATTGLKVNILSANTKSVGGVGYGQMVLELPKDEADREAVIAYFKRKGLAISEVET